MASRSFYQRHIRIPHGTRDIALLCAAWDFATRPYDPRTDHEIKRSSQLARAIHHRMERLGYKEGRDYRVILSGSRWPQWIRVVL